MLINVIMFLTMYPCIFIIYFTLKDMGKENNGRVFGVTLPWELRNQDEIKNLQENYKKDMKKNMWLMTILGFPGILISSFSFMYLYFIIWVTLVIVWPYMIFVRYNKRLAAKKKEKQWVGGENVQMADMKAAAEGTGCLKKWQYIPAVVISALPVIYDLMHYVPRESSVLLILNISFLCVAALVAYIAYSFDAARCEVISMDSRVNIEFTRFRKKKWNTCWLFVIWSSVLYQYLLWLTIRLADDLLGLLSLLFSLAYIALLLLIVYRSVYAIRAREKESRKRAELAGTDLQVDDDEYWIWGSIYYNPNDSHFMVEKRVGIGTSMNMAKKSAKVLCAVLALTLLILPASGVLVFVEEYVPMHLKVEDDTLVARQWKTDYQIEFSDIVEAKIVSKPHTTSKINGSAVGDVCKGLFQVKDYGRCDVFMNRSNDIYLYLVDQDGNQYFMTGNNDRETEVIYSELTAALP